MTTTADPLYTEHASFYYFGHYCFLARNFATIGDSAHRRLVGCNGYTDYSGSRFDKAQDTIRTAKSRASGHTIIRLYYLF